MDARDKTDFPAAVEERSCQEDDEPSFPRLPLLRESRVVEFARTPVPLLEPVRLSSPAPAANVPPSSLLVSSGRSSVRFADDDGDVGCCSRNSKSSMESADGCLSRLPPVQWLMSSQPRVRDRVVVDDGSDAWTAVDPFNTGSSWPGSAAWHTQINCMPLDINYSKHAQSRTHGPHAAHPWQLGLQPSLSSTHFGANGLSGTYIVTYMHSIGVKTVCQSCRYLKIVSVIWNYSASGALPPDSHFQGVGLPSRPPNDRARMIPPQKMIPDTTIPAAQWYHYRVLPDSMKYHRYSIPDTGIVLALPHDLPLESAKDFHP